jgi:hypothetical protein
LYIISLTFCLFLLVFFAGTIAYSAGQFFFIIVLPHLISNQISSDLNSVVGRTGKNLKHPIVVGWVVEIAQLE